MRPTPRGSVQTETGASRPRSLTSASPLQGITPSGGSVDAAPEAGGT